MSGNISFNPQGTTNALGSFNVDTDGYIQGTALNDPSVRNELAGGTVALTETAPMWGGMAITENITVHPGGKLGPKIGRATTITNLTGFTVFDQDHSMINFPQSPVPQAPLGAMVNFYRLGSNARIAVACSPTLVDIEGNIISTSVSWDFANQRLEPYVSTTISSGTYATAATVSAGTYTTATGAVTLTTNAAHGLHVGDTFTLDTFAGTGSFASLNGTWVATAGTTGSTLNFVAPAGLTLTITSANLKTVGVTLTTAAAHGLLPGDTVELSAITGTGSFATLNGEQTATVGTTGTTLNFTHASGLTMTITGGTVGSGGILPVKVLDISLAKSMTVVYNATTGFLTWNRADTVAIILL